MTEIGHITGMYALWDALLAEFPHLLIDNCCGGGRRIDIETMRRSIPLCRTDYPCADSPCEGIQCHHQAYAPWVPYSGTCPDRSYDLYRFRSAYVPAMYTGHPSALPESFGDDPEKMRWLKEKLEEYLFVRPYLSADFYPLTEVSDRTDIWAAARWDRPEQGDGILQVFRRENAPYETAVFPFERADTACSYVFRDLDGTEEIRIDGAELAAKGFRVTLADRPCAKIWLYRKG